MTRRKENVMSNITLEPSHEVVETNGHGGVPVDVLMPGKSPKKNRRWLALGGAAAFLALTAAVPAVRSAYTHESTDDAFIDGHIIAISPRVSGQVMAVRIIDNQLVRAGDLLVEIDPRDYQAKLDEERGKLAAAEAEARRA